MTAPDMARDDPGPGTVRGVQSGAQGDRARDRTGEKTYNVCLRAPSRRQATDSAGPGSSRRQDHKQSGTEGPWLSSG